MLFDSLEDGRYDDVFDCFLLRSPWDCSRQRWALRAGGCWEPILWVQTTAEMWRTKPEIRRVVQLHGQSMDVHVLFMLFVSIQEITEDTIAKQYTYERSLWIKPLYIYCTFIVG